MKLKKEATGRSKSVTIIQDLVSADYRNMFRRSQYKANVRRDGS